MGVNEYVRIGDKIKSRRKACRYTQRHVANELNIPYSTYSNYENNNREPSFDMLKKIASVLGVSFADLMGWDDNAHVGHIAREVHELELVEKDLLSVFRLLNVSGQKKAIAYMNDLLKIDDYQEKE